jgi:hypothetical protein
VWQEVPVPPKVPAGAYMVWSYAANYSKFEWHVSIEDGGPVAKNGKGIVEKDTKGPKFNPKVGKLHEMSAFAAVDDGWLVGFNDGEFGAALYWFSSDGKHNYKISDHQVVSFFLRPDGLYAVEGLEHMSLSKGSLIRIVRSKGSVRWRSETVAELPSAPYALSSRRNGTVLVTLSKSLVSIGLDDKITTLLADAPWGELYPNSSILMPDERRLYIGMRQFVGEFDLITNKLRLLVPSVEFLNKLPKEQEDRIRKQFGE